MKRILLLSALSIGLLSSCTTAFKAGQTPDDVYFSPGKEVMASEKEERVQKQEEEQYQEYISSLDDRYLRMKVANRNRWGAIDNFDYWYDSRYDFNTCNYNSFMGHYNMNPNWNWSLGYGFRNYYPGYGYGYGGGWSSPIYTVIGYTNPKFVGGSTSGSNISAYRNKTYNNTNYGYKDPKTGAFVPGSNNSSFGNLLKRVFSGSETTQSYDRPARTFEQPSNTSRTTTTPTPPPATSSNAGGSSGGYGSTGSSTSTGRGGRGN